MIATINRLWRSPRSESARGTAFATRAEPSVKSDALALPKPPEVLEPHILYPRNLPATFDRVACNLDHLTADQAAALRQRVAESGLHVEDVAKELGLTDDNVQQVLAVHGCDIYVDARHFGTPRLLTWEARLRRAGAAPQLRKVSAQELAVLRQQRGAGQQQDTDLQTLTLARRLIADCAVLVASDIHILVREHHTEIQVRIKGDLRTVSALSMRREEGERLIRAMYTGLATVKAATYNPLDVQDAQIAGDALPGTGLSSVRIVRGPAYPVESGGGFLVARLQYREHHEGALKADAFDAAKRLDLRTPKAPGGEFKLGQMGYTPLQVELISQLLRRPMGVIVVTGPTGSGKTTTLFECTRHQARLFPEKRLVTIENPTEYPMDWAIQLTTESERFPEMLRMTLRMDPDAVLLGEIRGVEEAIATLQAAATGHQVLTTLHVTDPFETFSRLVMLDHVRLAMEVIANHTQIIGLIAQRIVPLLCPKCSVTLDKAPEPLPDYMLKAMRSWGDLSEARVRGAGCGHCHGEGIIGQQAVAEVVVTSEKLMQDCINDGVSDARRNHRAREGSDKPMIAHAMDLVLAGRLSPVDAERSVDAIPMREDV
ncbi:GspE/PulE family protein [Cupriavidus sp. L7L]|uniref:GspE/PulE family protein n=1 Tax=Cupriavidus sp. L7L TaxID=2546443 RepID=UPI0010551C18|nr:ATPase, T2SS/T4P/T4SS family [Cupriavidus sp. L7L]TDF64884.1 type II secretion system protein E [Cupriavidus sp. L7L]